MKFELDKQWIGLAVGIALPIITIFLFYFFNVFFHADTFTDYIKEIAFIKYFTKVFSLCVIPNLGMFFLFDWKKMPFSQRGVLFATLLYAIGIFIFFFAF